jgi:hypothetical protein
MNETRTPADEPAHDVLAAEAFAVPAPDPELSHGPVDLPDDPAGIEEPHDILAAEEFAMPAGRPARAGAALARHAKSSRWFALSALAGALVAMAVARVLRRR